MDALKKLRKDLSKNAGYESGTVIRWRFLDQYTYVAVFANGRWYTSSTRAVILSRMA